MYRYFLGAFGNNYYIKPYCEINEDNTISEISDEGRWGIFPNGGTVSVYFPPDINADSIKNRLLKFKVDMQSDLHQRFDPNNENSNKYQIRVDRNIEELKHDEIIEIIDLECTFEEFKNDKTKRELRINHKPNQLILLREKDFCYGPFDIVVSDVENYTDDEAFYTIKVILNSEFVNQYRYFDIEHIVFEGGFSIRRYDKLQFIYNKDRLDSIDPVDVIECYDNEQLAELMISLLENEDDITELAKLKEKFIRIADSFSDVGNYEGKLRRIVDILTKTTKFDDFKVRITEEYFKNNPQSEADKERYLESHNELLVQMAKENIGYEEEKKSLEDELNELKSEISCKQEEYRAEEQKLANQKIESERFAEEVLTQRKQELQTLEITKKKIEEDISAKDREVAKLKEERDRWAGYKEEVKKEYNDIVTNIDAKIIEWAEQNRTAEITKFLMYRLETPDSVVTELDDDSVYDVLGACSADDIVNLLKLKFEEAGRHLSNDDAYNLLISIVQNYITVFAGEPGTGKTSLCKLFAKALGLYTDRFAEILVERGWTSSRDLVGYYNPLTKEIEETQPQFSACMKKLDFENKNKRKQVPYLVLLDEANLSPIEYYWSNFNFFCDSPIDQEVTYSNGVTYKFGPELKFLATINYDQTTSDLSPRFLDRAWVIPMNTVNLESVLAGMSNDSSVANNEKVMSMEVLEQHFGWSNCSEKRMNNVTQNRLNRVVELFKDGGHMVSARSIKAIVHYYLVAEKYMSTKEVALDFAIAQKLLPQLSGNGKKYLEFLNNLMSICKENQLTRSANIIDRIIRKSEYDFYAYFIV